MSLHGLRLPIVKLFIVVYKLLLQLYTLPPKFLTFVMKQRICGKKKQLDNRRRTKKILNLPQNIQRCVQFCVGYIRSLFLFLFFIHIIADKNTGYPPIQQGTRPATWPLHSLQDTCPERVQSGKTPGMQGAAAVEWGGMLIVCRARSSLLLQVLLFVWSFRRDTLLKNILFAHDIFFSVIFFISQCKSFKQTSSFKVHRNYFK